jgi:hypothetical protein
LPLTSRRACDDPLEGPVTAEEKEEAPAPCGRKSLRLAEGKEEEVFVKVRRREVDASGGAIVLL